MFAQLVKRGVWQGALLVLAAAVLAFSVNALRDDGLPLLPRHEVRTHAPVTPRTIGLADALNHFRSHAALFLDARADYEFETGHIPGAWSVPKGKRADLIGRLQGRAEPLFITYCSDEQCQLAEELAEELRLSGIMNVRVMREGWLAWSNAGFPVEGQP